MKVNLGVKHAEYPTGEKLSDVMRWNHYGTETIPPRPVLRIAAEKIIKNPEFEKVMKAYFKNIMANPDKSEHELLEKELLRKIGQQSAAEAKRIIRAGMELIDNAPSTIAKKGYNKPLFETGLMIRNIDYEVVEE
jgi:hypothetical protein